MVQFQLPKNSKIKKGKVHNSPKDGNFKKLNIYRFDPDKNKMVTERVNRQTLKDWDKKKFKVAKSMAALIQANLEPIILKLHVDMPLQMSRTEASQLSLITGKSEAELLAQNKKDLAMPTTKAGYLTGADIASIIDELNKFLKLDEKVTKTESEIETGKKEVARWLSQGPSNNIDL